MALKVLAQTAQENA